MKVYIGHDEAEKKAYQAACKSLHAFSGLTAEPIDSDRLRASGLLTRPVDARGQRYDIYSNAPCSTDFAVSRFLVPVLCQSGWALFVDSDVIFLSDPRELLELADPDKAVMVVKHSHDPQEASKMCGMAQTRYRRKNWSSVMLINCSHPANKRLSVRDVNERPGRDLHAFYWLNDSEIGELPERFNWLVDVNDRPDPVSIAHMTLGGPWIEGWEGGSFDREWLQWTE